MTSFDKEPSVVLPLSLWEELQDYIEDLEMQNSSSLKKNIKKARDEAKRGMIVPFEKL